MVEGGNVRVGDDDSGDEPEPRNPARSWRLAVAIVIGFLAAVVLFVPTLRSTEEPPSNPPEAAPVATTTTASPTTTTTSTPATTTTTVWWGATDAAVVLQDLVLTYCERASPAGVDGMKALDEWIESLFIDGAELFYHVEDSVRFETAQARNAQDARLVGLLESVLDNLEDTEAAIDLSSHTMADEGSDEWMNQVALAERHCGRATATIATMTRMIDDSPTRAVGQVIRDLAIAIEPDIRAFCEGASPVGTDGPKDFDAWTESWGEDFVALHGGVVETVGSEVGKVRANLEVHHRTRLDYVYTNLGQADSALHEAFRAGEDGQADEWTYQVARIERHCARAITTIVTMVALSQK